MRHQWKGFLAGILSAVLLFGLIGTVGATVGQKTVVVDYNNIKVTMNGKAVNLVDANGKTVEPFVIKGTTYLPVRAVATALGLDVDWDAKTQTVKLSNEETVTTNPGTDDDKIFGVGVYTAGKDFPAGTYDIVLVSGYGMVKTVKENGNVGVYGMFGSKDLDESLAALYEVQCLERVQITDGVKLDVSTFSGQSFTVKLVKK